MTPDPAEPARTAGDHSLAWSLLLGPVRGAGVLEASADQGARAAALRERGARVVALRATRAEAEALRRTRQLDAVALAAPAGSLREPLDLAVVSLALGRSRRGAWAASDPRPLLTAVLEALAPGAALAVSLSNPLHELPLLAPLLDRLLGLAPPAGPPRGTSRPRLLCARSLRALLGGVAGLEDLRVYAPVPHACRPKFLVPLGEPAVIDYFFASLVPRPATPARRRALAATRLAARLGAFEFLPASYEIYARKALAP